MGPRRRRSSNWRAAPAVGHSSRETKLGPHASSGREGPVRILANEGDGTDELPENVGFQRHSRAQLSADSNATMESFFDTLKSEFFYLKKFLSIDELQAGLKDYIRYYNNDRIKLRLRGLSPVEYRKKYKHH